MLYLESLNGQDSKIRAGEVIQFERSYGEIRTLRLHEDIKQLVVMIEATLGGMERYGAGIIFGTGADSLSIVTANHVVRAGGIEA